MPLPSTASRQFKESTRTRYASNLIKEQGSPARAGIDARLSVSIPPCPNTRLSPLSGLPLGQGFLRLVPPEAGSAQDRLHSSLAIEASPQPLKPALGVAPLHDEASIGPQRPFGANREPWVPPSLRLTMAWYEGNPSARL